MNDGLGRLDLARCVCCACVSSSLGLLCSVSSSQVGRVVVLDGFTADQGNRALWEPMRALADDVAVFDRTAGGAAERDARSLGAEVGRALP